MAFLFPLISSWVYINPLSSLLSSLTSFWGFKNLLQILSMSGGTSDGLIILYVLSSLVIFGLITLNYLLKQFQRA